jgi:hypothetical protein
MSLEVCLKCGWHRLQLDTNHARECDPGRGSDANNLAIKLGQMGVDVPSTKLGYGYGNITFEPCKGVSVTFQCDGNGKFRLEHVFWIKDIDFDIAAKLVQSLAACAKIVPETHACTCGGARDQHFYMPGPRACEHCASCQGYVARSA